jgi:hypothetical protein
MRRQKYSGGLKGKELNPHMFVLINHTSAVVQRIIEIKKNHCFCQILKLHDFNRKQ